MVLGLDHQVAVCRYPNPVGMCVQIGMKTFPLSLCLGLQCPVMQGTVCFMGIKQGCGDCTLGMVLGTIQL